MNRVYHRDDYKSLAVDLLCIINLDEVNETLSKFSLGGERYDFIHVAAILTLIGNNITSKPQIVDDTLFKQAVDNKH